MNKFNETTNLEDSSTEIESKFSIESKQRTQRLREQYADYLKPIPPVLPFGRRSPSYPPQRRPSPVKPLQSPCETVPQGCDPARKRRGRAPVTANENGTQPAPVASFGTNNLSTSAGKALAPQGHPPVKKKRCLSKSAKAAVKAAARFAIKVAADAAVKQAAAVAAKAAAEAAAKVAAEAADRVAKWPESDSDSVNESESESDTESDGKSVTKSDTESDAKSETNLDTTADTN